MKSMLNQHFKLKKDSKRYLATIHDAHLRGQLKKILSVAQYESTLKKQPRKQAEEKPEKDPVSGLIEKK